MHGDYSLYESKNNSRLERSNGIAFGRVIKVFAKERYCQVHTFNGSGNMSDNVLDRVQWLSMDSNPEGDESTSIPRKNSLGLIFFVGGEPFLFGFFKPLKKGGVAAQGNEPVNLMEGDKLISTVAGNRLTVKSNGLIEIFSTESLKSVRFPTESKLLEICRRYDLRTDGGSHLWESDEDGKTLLQSEFRRDLLRAVVACEEKGAVDDSTILKTVVGPANPGGPGVLQPLYEHTVGTDGTAELNVGIAKNFAASISPTGEARLKVNDLTTLTISPTGEITVKTPGATLTISPEGAVSLQALGQVSLTGGGLPATEQPLTFPTTTSHFTGLPLAPGSQNIRLSK